MKERIDMQILTEDYAIWWSGVKQSERAKAGVRIAINQNKVKGIRIYKRRIIVQITFKQGSYYVITVHELLRQREQIRKINYIYIKKD